jgi:hypothetical protein
MNREILPKRTTDLEGATVSTVNRVAVGGGRGTGGGGGDLEGGKVLETEAEINAEKKETFITVAHYIGFFGAENYVYKVEKTPTYKENGQSIINEWLQIVQSFVLIVASNTSYNPQYFEIKNQKPEQTWVTKYTERRIIDKTAISSATDTYRPPVPVIIKTWREDIISMVYNISVEPSLEEIKNLKTKHNWNNITNSENKLKFDTNNIESILTNRVERVILAEFVGERYQNKRQKLINAEYLDVLNDKIRIFCKLKRYFLDNT